jgi:hypothetical protein
MIPGRATWNPSTLQDKLTKTLRDPEWAWELFSKARPNGSRRVWFIDVPGFSKKAPKSSSASNPNSVNVTSRLASWIIDKIGQDEVHVISMYGHEIGLIRDQLSDWNKPSVDVQTVESYQGKEGEAIVIHCSAAWKNRWNPLGFLTDIHRLNVDITRAKKVHVHRWQFQLLGVTHHCPAQRYIQRPEWQAQILSEAHRWSSQIALTSQGTENAGPLQQH